MPFTLAVAYYYTQPIGRSNSVAVLMCCGWEYSRLQPKGLVVSHGETWVDWDVSRRMIDNSKWVTAHLFDETRPRRSLEMLCELDRARETVATDVFRARAMSFIVMFLSFMKLYEDWWCLFFCRLWCVSCHTERNPSPVWNNVTQIDKYHATPSCKFTVASDVSVMFCLDFAPYRFHFVRPWHLRTSDVGQNYTLLI